MIFLNFFINSHDEWSVKCKKVFTTKLEFLIDDIYIEFRGQICQQLVLYIKKSLPVTYIDILEQMYTLNNDI
jgi:hypothetical protein